MTAMLKSLEQIGLHKNEAKVYEALVKFGPCKAGLLINKLDLHRNLVYESLENLVLKGYATKYIKDKVWHFQITDPHGLLAEVKQKEALVSELVREIATYQHKATQQIVVYEGIESYRNYWIESLERVPAGTVDYCVGAPSNDRWIELMGSRYKQYLDLRLKKKIYWKTLHYKMTESEREMLRKYPKLTEYRLWERDVDCIGNFNIIHDTVILHAITDPPRIIEIRDPSMVIIFRNYFDMLWEKGKSVER
jgi:sugar-specific transcriptional regulator TrmB